MKRNASMRLGALLPVLVALACLALAPALHAQDCGKPPEGYGKEWGKAFAKWCSCVGGRLSDNAQECLDVPKGKRG